MKDIIDVINDAIRALGKAKEEILHQRRLLERIKCEDDPQPTQCPHCEGTPGEEGYLPLRRHHP